MSQFCTNVTQERVRATVKIGGVSVTTPYVKAFNINQDKSKLAATFSATLEIYAGTRLYVGADVEIYDEVNGVEKKRFTGEIRNISTQPSFDKAGYYILNISGVDKLGVLEGKRFSRRLRSDGFSLFVSIDGGPSNRATRGVSIDKTVRNGKHTMASHTPSITDSKGEHAPIIHFPKRGSKSGGGIYGKADSLSGTDKGDKSGTIDVHDHTTLEKGGPAFGVYSIY